ncbi:hypothetical protein MESMUL_16970 [Mesosutterella multiformis]|uniref:Uncharacterized protein n=1 Tax=Mesosutterella multiformis TaxID=2259133 RepID=A0A388SF89_9BURK|nr:hypothetical protein MESMUL_16970 [Mesosutterella multiformis]
MTGVYDLKPICRLICAGGPISEKTNAPGFLLESGGGCILPARERAGSRSEERLLLRDVFARDHTEGQSVKHSDRSEADAPWTTARDSPPA